jgi:hypothetical protein
MEEWRYSSTNLDILITYSGKLHASIAYLRIKGPSVHIGEEAERSGICGVQKESCLCLELNPSRPYHSLSLYRLNFPARTASYRKLSASTLQRLSDCKCSGKWSLKINLFSDVTSCRIMDGYRRWAWDYWHYIPLLPWKWRQNVTPNNV